VLSMPLVPPGGDTRCWKFVFARSGSKGIQLLGLVRKPMLGSTIHGVRETGRFAVRGPSGSYARSLVATCPTPTPKASNASGTVPRHYRGTDGTQLVLGLLSDPPRKNCWTIAE
jgi:hypothetical protein